MISKKLKVRTLSFAIVSLGMFTNFALASTFYQCNPFGVNSPAVGYGDSPSAAAANYCGKLGFSYSGVSEAGAPFHDCEPHSVCTVAQQSCSSSPNANDPDTGCFEPPKQCPDGVGNPCDPATGNKFQLETDFGGTMSLKRNYNSINLMNTRFGRGWRSNHQRALVVQDGSIYLIRSNGRGEPWQKVNGVWQGDADTAYILVEDATGYSVTRGDGTIEMYNAIGRLESITNPEGDQWIYQYTNGLLISVTNQYGHSITYEYELVGPSQIPGNIIKVTDPSGAEYRYEYDTNANLTAVIYPDLTPGDPNDNPRRIYHYDNSGFPNHLTGITDENGNRYATYAYDAQGRATSTEHAQTTNTVGQERFQLSY